MLMRNISFFSAFSKTFFNTGRNSLDYSRLSLYNYLCINLKSKSYDGDSKFYSNIAASREWCEPGISRLFPNITPEPQPPKQRKSKG